MVVHTIRLREPWDRGHGDCGAERLSRKFNTPTGLSASSRVFLAVAGLESFARVMLNGHTLKLPQKQTGSARWDMTEQLLSRNEVSLLLKPSLHASGLAPLVRLEIEERESENGGAGMTR